MQARSGFWIVTLQFRSWTTIKVPGNVFLFTSKFGVRDSHLFIGLIFETRDFTLSSSDGVNLLYIVVQPKGVDSVARDSVVAPKYIFIKRNKMAILALVYDEMCHKTVDIADLMPQFLTENK